MSQVDEARASVKTADARVEELQAVINDSTIKSPVEGRLQYRLVELGAVLPQGGKIATVINLNDVYTTVYLPSAQAGRLKLGMTPTLRASSSMPTRTTSSPHRSVRGA